MGFKDLEQPLEEGHQDVIPKSVRVETGNRDAETEEPKVLLDDHESSGNQKHKGENTTTTLSDKDARASEKDAARSEASVVLEKRRSARLNRKKQARSLPSARLVTLSHSRVKWATATRLYCACAARHGRRER